MIQEFFFPHRPGSVRFSYVLLSPATMTHIPATGSQLGLRLLNSYVPLLRTRKKSVCVQVVLLSVLSQISRRLDH